MPAGITITAKYDEDGNYAGLEFTGASFKKSLRPAKGNSLLEKLEDFTAIDIETTGLYIEIDDIIELGAVRYRGGKEVDRFQQLVKPETEISEFFTNLTGITNDILADAPSIEAVLPAYLTFLGEDVVIGHNVNFDINFIYDSCETIGLPPIGNDFIDTMRIARRLHPEWPNHKLDTAMSMLLGSSRQKHRSADDARVAGDIYLAMAADERFAEAAAVLKRHGGKSLSAKDIVAAEGKSNENSPLFGKVCVFTGTLESFPRRQAMQLVADIGGICEDRVTERTNYLILGNNDYCATIKGGKSSKQKKAESLILKGADLQILPETVFLDILSSEGEDCS